jgi:1-phosphofructokinase family hexose kinase
LIFTITLNPAIDKILFLNEFVKTKTNRLDRVVETLGGKGTHVSINLKLLGVQSTALGITIGENGKRITQLMEGWGIDVRFLHYDLEGLESRTNYEIVEESDHACSMVTEKGPILPRFITNDLLDQLDRLVHPGDIVVLTGDASNVEDTSIYVKLTKAAKDHEAKVFLDASGPYLAEGIKSRPYLIKPNLEELGYITGREISSEADIVSALIGLSEYGIEIIAMTWSGKGAVIKYGESMYRIDPIKVHVINEGGCGDAFLAAIIAGIVKGSTIEETLKSAAAVAGTAAESEITAGFDPSRADKLINDIVVTKISGISSK